MPAILKKDFGQGGKGSDTFTKENMYDLLASLISDVAALKGTQDAVIDAADDTARNAVTKTTVGTTKE